MRAMSPLSFTRSMSSILYSRLSRYTCLYPDLGPSTRHPELQLRDFRGPEVLDAITGDYLKGIADEVVRKWDAFESRRRSRRASFILVVGGPGVGKGTQCARAAVKYGLAHISVGDLLRHERADEKSHFKEFISKSIEKRFVVPPALVIEAARSRARQRADKGQMRDPSRWLPQKRATARCL